MKHLATLCLVKLLNEKLAEKDIVPFARLREITSDLSAWLIRNKKTS